MKQIYIGNDGIAGFDTDKQEMYALNRVPDRITNVLVINEPTKVVVQNFDDTQYTLDADKGDLVVTFYTNDYEKRAVLVKCEDWYNNIVKYNELEARRKEEWAVKHAERDIPTCGDCEKGC